MYKYLKFNMLNIIINTISKEHHIVSFTLTSPKVREIKKKKKKKKRKEIMDKINNKMKRFFFRK